MKFLEVYGEDDYGVAILEEHYQGRRLQDLWKKATNAEAKTVRLDLDSEVITAIAHDLDVTEEEHDLMKFTVWGDDDLQQGYDLLPVESWKKRGTADPATRKVSGKRVPPRKQRKYLEVLGEGGGVDRFSDYPVDVLNALWQKAGASKSRELTVVIGDSSAGIWQRSLGNDCLVAIERVPEAEFIVWARSMSISPEVFEKFASVWRRGQGHDYHDLIPLDEAMLARRAIQDQEDDDDADSIED